MMWDQVAVSAALWYALWGGVVPPPAQYDHPYRGRLYVHYAHPERLKFECFTSRNINGCAQSFRKGHCTIYISSELSKQEKARVYRHERAHCNGWNKDHRG